MNPLLLLGMSGVCGDPRLPPPQRARALLVTFSYPCQGLYPTHIQPVSCRSSGRLGGGLQYLPRKRWDLNFQGPSVSLDPHSSTCPRPKFPVSTQAPRPPQPSSEHLRRGPAPPASGLSLQFCFRPSVFGPALPGPARPRATLGPPPALHASGSHRSKSSLTEKTPAASGNTERMCRARG